MYINSKNFHTYKTFDFEIHGTLKSFYPGGLAANFHRGDRKLPLCSPSISTQYSDVGSYLRLGGQVITWGTICPPLAEIGLYALPKTGWAIAHPAHPSPTSLSVLSSEIRRLDDGFQSESW